MNAGEVVDKRKRRIVTDDARIMNRNCRTFEKIYNFRFESSSRTANHASNHGIYMIGDMFDDS